MNALRWGHLKVGMGNQATLRSLLTRPWNIRKDNLKRGDSLPPNQHRALCCPLSQVPLMPSLFSVPQSCQEPDVQLSPVFQEALLNVPAQVSFTALLISYCAQDTSACSLYLLPFSLSLPCLILWELPWHVILQQRPRMHLTPPPCLRIPLPWYLITPFHCFHLSLWFWFFWVLY